MDEGYAIPVVEDDGYDDDDGVEYCEDCGEEIEGCECGNYDEDED